MSAYDRILDAMRSAGSEAAKEGALRLLVGEVITPDPLKVEVAGTNQEAARFWICHRLLSKHKEKLDVECSKISGHLDIYAACGSGAHNSMDVNDGTLSLKATAAQDGPVLKKGDQVLLLTDDDQVFYLIDKVVRLS